MKKYDKYFILCLLIEITTLCFFVYCFSLNTFYFDILGFIFFIEFYLSLFLGAYIDFKVLRE